MGAIAGDFFTNLERLQTLPLQQEFKARVVYGGAERQRRRKVDVVPWNEIKDMSWW